MTKDKIITPEIAYDITKPLVELLDYSELSNEYVNKVLFNMWCCGHIELFTKLITNIKFILDNDVIKVMQRPFKYIINNDVKLNEENTKRLLESYLDDDVSIPEENMKAYLTNVGFKQTSEVIKNFYARLVAEKTKKFV